MSTCLLISFTNFHRGRISLRLSYSSRLKSLGHDHRQPLGRKCHSSRQTTRNNVKREPRGTCLLVSGRTMIAALANAKEKIAGTGQARKSENVSHAGPRVRKRPTFTIEIHIHEVSLVNFNGKCVRKKCDSAFEGG